MLCVRNIRFGYEPHKMLFSGLEFKIDEGERVHVRGPNGIGKTTLLKILSGMMPDWMVSYEAYWFGEPKTLPDLRPVIGFVTDKPQLFESLTGVDNTRVFQILWGCGDDYRRRVRELCDMFRLSAKDLAQPVESYSLGMRQKLFIALVLARSAKLFLLDEPFNGLDIESRNALVDWIKGKRDASFVVVAHVPYDGLVFNREFDLSVMVKSNQT